MAMTQSDISKLKTSGRPTCGPGFIYDRQAGMCISLTEHRGGKRKQLVKGASA